MHLGGSGGGRRADDEGSLDRLDRGAASPIGVLLLVAVSIVLVGAVGVFVFDLGEGVGDPAPQARFDTAYNDTDGAVVLTHAGGETIDTDRDGNLTVVVTDASTGDVRRYAWSGAADGRIAIDSRFVVDDAVGSDTGNVTVPWTFAAGDRVVVRADRDGATYVLTSYTVDDVGVPALSFSLDPQQNRTLAYSLDETPYDGTDVAYARGATSASGKHGDAYAFDGDDHAALRQSYDDSNAFAEVTACAWFRTSEDDTGEFDNWALLDFDRSEYFNLYVRGDGRVGFSTSAAGGGSSINDTATPAGTSYADGSWHHACGVYEDDGTKRIYVDGTLVVTEAGVHGGSALGSGATRYGFIGDGSEASSFDGSRNGKHYDGEVDDVRLYDAALDASAVGDAADPATAPTANLSLYYPLDDVVTSDGGFQVEDSSPRDGQPTGTAYAFSGEPGVYDTAFGFNDGEYVALNASYDQNGALDEFSTCAWFRTTHSGGGQSANWALLDFDRSEYFNLYVHGDGRVGFSTSSDAGTGSVDDLFTSGTYNDGDWHLACGVYDDGEKRILVDGVESVSVENVHGGDALGSGATRYGFIGDGSEATSFDGSRNGRHFTGRIDEVRVYDRALAESTTAGMYVDGVGATGDRTVTTEPREFATAVDPSTLTVEDVVATAPGSSSVEIRVESDPDGDGVFEGTSDPITPGSAPANVTGLSTDSARYRLNVTLDADGGDVPDFESARLVDVSNAALASPTVLDSVPSLSRATSTQYATATNHAAATTPPWPFQSSTNDLDGGLVAPAARAEL